MHLPIVCVANPWGSAPGRWLGLPIQWLTSGPFRAPLNTLRHLHYHAMITI